jgi:short-subunit dehydrogenase
MRNNIKDADGDRGVIVNVASMGGLLPMPFSPVYAATKHGVVGLCRSLEVVFVCLVGWFKW